MKEQFLRHARFVIVWAARLLLPVVYILTQVKPVVIPPPDSPSASLPPPTLHEHVTPLVIFTHSRDEYLTRTLTSVLKHHPGGPGWPIIITKDQQDGEHPAVDAVVAAFRPRLQDRNITLLEWAHAFNYDNDDEGGKDGANAPDSPFVDRAAYRRIAHHYGWALGRAFEGGADGLPGAARQVVVLEDDMEIAPDFFDYFNALRPVLHEDASLMCVSAWNDNGVAALSLNASQLHRTDFFPGLGWMLSAGLWRELQPDWPSLFWDDWLRHPDRTRGRQCVRPEVSRVGNFGERGVSNSFHYTTHVSQVVHANESVDMGALDLGYLREAEYHKMFFERMSKAVRLRFSNYLTTRPQERDVIAFYPEEHIESIGKRTGIMVDHRNGIRRTSYHGVIVIPWNGYWAFIVKRGWEPPEGYTLGDGDCC